MELSMLNEFRDSAGGFLYRLIDIEVLVGLSLELVERLHIFNPPIAKSSEADLATAAIERNISP